MDSKELVERWREHGPATGATLLEIAVSAGMPDDKRVKWCQALQYASTVADRAIEAIAAQDARIEALEGDRDAWQKKFVLAWPVLVYVEAASDCADSRADAKAAMDAIAALGGEQHGN